MFKYIDDVFSLSINNPHFSENLHIIYPNELEIKDTTESRRSASYLDLLLEIVMNGRLNTKVYDKRDDFNIPSVNIPFLSSNIPAAPAYGVYISQLIRYGRACSCYDDFAGREKLLTGKLLQQGYEENMLKSPVRKFYGHHHELMDHYATSISQVSTDLFPSAQ